MFKYKPFNSIISENMLNPDIFVSTILLASITAAGLLIAIIGVILPRISDLMLSRYSSYQKAVDNFHKSTSNVDKVKYEDMVKTWQNVEEYKEPLPFKEETVTWIFGLYVASVIMCSLWFFIPSDIFLIGIFSLFILATLMFSIFLNSIVKMVFNMFEEERNRIENLKKMNFAPEAKIHMRSG